VTDELDAKLARLNQRVQSQASTVRAELDAIGFLAEAGHLRERFGARLVYLKTPRIEQGDHALMRPGVVGWTQYIPPKAKVQNDVGPRGARSAPTSKGRNRREEGSEGGLLGGSE
jgi:hypothetical protein